jgi:esterase/lipase superfamily enzyme
MVVVDGVDTIDATRVDTSLIGLGHSYFGSKRSILEDIADMIEHRTEPSRRFQLREAGRPPRRHWEYRE